MFDKKIHNPHPTFAFAKDEKTPKAIEVKNLCKRLWEQFKEYADTNFLNEFSKDFESRFWEMDLTCALLNHGYNITSKNEGPDIQINDREEWIWIEAVAPSNGESADKVPDSPKPSEPIKVRDVPNDQVILRFTSSIDEKFEKYNHYLKKGTISRKEPYVIAINSLKLSSQTDYEPPRIVRTVFPFGSPQIAINKKTLKTVDNGFEYRQEVIKKNLKAVPINLFLDPKYAGISAILFSSAGCLNRPKIITDSYIIVHNPLADNPIKASFFNFGREYFAIQTENDEYKLQCIEHYK